MKTPLNVDWPLIQALYLRNVPPHELAARFQIKVGTIQKRAVRGKWTTLRTKVTEVLSLQEQGGLKKQEGMPSLQDRSSSVRSLLAADLHATAEILPEVERSTNPAALKERQSVVSAVVSDSEKVFAWNEGPQVKPLIDVELLSQLSLSEPRSGPPLPGTICVTFNERGEPIEHVWPGAIDLEPQPGSPVVPDQQPDPA